jgi:hypothetical protein
MSEQVLDRTEVKAQAAALKAQAKAMRPWFKKKRFIIPIVLAALFGLMAITGGGGSDTDTSVNDEPAATESASDDAPATGSAAGTDTRRQGLYPERADIQSDDHEANLGESVRLSGYTATVTGAEIATPEFGDPQLVVHVGVENRDDAAQPYNLFDWRVQNEAGQVLDPTINLRDDDLSSGDLVNGGTVSGTVAFDVPAGTYYVIYKPDAFDAARGIWKVTV